MNEFRRRQCLQRMADFGDRHFDPGSGWLRLPEPPGNGQAGGPTSRTVRASLDYALVLLELAERLVQGRAETIIGRVTDLDASGWRPEGPDFTGATLVLIWHRHRRRLGTEVAAKTGLALVRTADGLRDEGAENPHVPVGKLFLLLSVAEMTGREDLFSAASSRLDRLEGTGAGLDAIPNYLAGRRTRDLLEPRLANARLTGAFRLPTDDGQGFDLLPACVPGFELPVTSVEARGASCL